MSNLFISYIILSPDLDNQFSDLTHKGIVEKLRNAFPNWKGFHKSFKDYNLGFTIVMDRGIDALQVKGPTIFRRTKDVDFSIFLPEKVELLNPDKYEDIEYYLDLIFSGLEIVLSQYDVRNEEIELIKNECKNEFVGLHN